MKQHNAFTELDLSSSPFRNRTTPYVLSLLLLFIAFATGLLLISKWRENTRLLEIASDETEQISAELEAERAQGELVQKELSPPQRELLIASHKLVANKNFGWSRLFSDLESVIPSGVSASRISVANIFEDQGRPVAELDFSVLSQDYRSAMAMIENMNNSGVFQAELRGQNLQTNQRFAYTEFTLRLLYTPAFGYSAESSGDIAQSKSGGGE